MPTYITLSSNLQLLDNRCRFRLQSVLKNHEAQEVDILLGVGGLHPLHLEKVEARRKVTHGESNDAVSMSGVSDG